MVSRPRMGSPLSTATQPSTTRAASPTGVVGIERQIMLDKVTKQKLVVIGNGMAGIRTVELLLDRAPDLYEITVFGSEPYGNYNRILLSPVLSGEKSVACKNVLSTFAARTPFFSDSAFAACQSGSAWNAFHDASRASRLG